MTCYKELNQVQKPYQYVGHEENTYNKDFDAAKVRMCIAFPDAYEIGMSNVGMQIIYHIVNEEEAYMADRAYAPLEDMGKMLKSTDQRLRGKESGRALKEFDWIGFTLQYELCYTNVLYMLDLGGVPLRAKDRKEGDPLVGAGGPCAFNPEPIADFMDFVVIGEGEDVTIEVCDTIARAKDQGLSRQATLKLLGALPGVYVPSFYEPSYDAETGRFAELKRNSPLAPRWVERRIIQDLDKAKYPAKPVTPAIKPIHERISVEIQRGCTRACRFCQAGYIYRPRRERNPNTIMNIIEQSVESTGITDIGLLSLSSADYSHIHPLMKSVMNRYKKEHLSVSLPSTRLEALEEEYLDVLKEERRSGFTIAPEAGSQRLRNVINKNFTEEEVVATAQMLFRNGWQSVKMYFMIGQPTETDEDVIAIAELGNNVMRKCTEIPGRKSITISVSNFVPKPHTPFQWHEQITPEEIKRKQKLIRDHIAFKNIQFRCHEADSSYAEGLLSRGDRRAADLVERVYKAGSVFDCWQDRFDVRLWREKVAELKEETGVDLQAEGMRMRDLDERLPWHRVYSGLHPKFFKNEWNKAVFGMATEDCSFSACHECGLCNDKNGVAPVVLREAVAMADKLPKGSDGETVDAPLPAAQVLRFQYQKIEEGIYISTLDMQNIFLRAFARAEIPIKYDNGLRPRPKLSMGPALPLGVSSRCELFDIHLHTDLPAHDVVAKINQFIPDHVKVLTGRILDDLDQGITHTIRANSYRVAVADLPKSATDLQLQLGDRIEEIKAAKSWIIERQRKARNGRVKYSKIELRSSLEALDCQDGDVRFTLSAPNGQGPSPMLVIDALLGEQESKDKQGVVIHKTGFHTAADRESAGLI